MPRFVVLEHDHPALHWDLMLEAGDVLKTWRLAEAPVLGRPIDATALADHRVMYLDYEGPISGDRGTVLRWDAGLFEEEADSMPEARALTLHGSRIAGRVRLERIEGTSWRFQWTQ
jgi:DNA polymerase Ligase (LigD)